MRVVVLGAGVIGVTSAYFLARAGHDVTVIEGREAPGLETSFANAGEISPGYASPWAAPGVPFKALKWLMMQHSPLILSRPFERETLPWLMSLLTNCTTSRYAINKSRMVRLAEYSRDVLRQLRLDTGIGYDERTLGTLQLFRTQKQVDGAAKDISVLRDYGVPFEVLDRKACEAAEPGLSRSGTEIAGGLRLPDDETGDCFIFTQSLAQLATELGVKFSFNTKIKSLDFDGEKICGANTDSGRIEADVFVVAAGNGSRRLLKGLKLNIPVVPVKGYSITMPIGDADAAPVSTVLDETYKVAITRLGDRIRIGGLAEIAGYDRDLNVKRFRTLVHTFSSLFPDAGRAEEGQFWTGLRPMTPDGTPIVGATSISNLYVNTGHGTLGWTMSCGSARLLSDLVSKTVPDIEYADLAMSRYSSGNQA